MPHAPNRPTPTLPSADAPFDGAGAFLVGWQYAVDAAMLADEARRAILPASTSAASSTRPVIEPVNTP